MKKEDVKVPEGTLFTLTVPLNRQGTKATYYLRDVDEETYLMFKDMVNSNKTLDAVRLFIESLALPGSDDVKLLRPDKKNNFIALNAAGPKVLEITSPLDSDLKKKLLKDVIPCDVKDGVVNLKDIFESHGLSQRIALIRFYFHEDPKTLSAFTRSWSQLCFALKFEGKLKEQVITKR